MFQMGGAGYAYAQNLHVFGVGLGIVGFMLAIGRSICPRPVWPSIAPAS